MILFIPSFSGSVRHVAVFPEKIILSVRKAVIAVPKPRRLNPGKVLIDAASQNSYEYLSIDPIAAGTP